MVTDEGVSILSIRPSRPGFVPLPRSVWSSDPPHAVSAIHCLVFQAITAQATLSWSPRKPL
jgi:hypothetical protein